MPYHPVLHSSPWTLGAACESCNSTLACRARHAPPQRRAAGLHQARRQPQLLLHGVQHAAPARVHAEVLKRAPAPHSMLVTSHVTNKQGVHRFRLQYRSAPCPTATTTGACKLADQSSHTWHNTWHFLMLEIKIFYSMSVQATIIACRILKCYAGRTRSLARRARASCPGSAAQPRSPQSAAARKAAARAVPE